MELSLGTKIALGVFVLLVFWGYRINAAMLTTPAAAAAASPRRFTKSEIRETYERAKREPIEYSKHLPSKENRRYIVVGGSGMFPSPTSSPSLPLLTHCIHTGAVGGFIVLQLLAQGHPPSAIRIIDFRRPTRDDLTTGPAAEIPVIQTDISSITEVRTAFALPWPADVAAFPLTVHHTAASIRPAERLAIHIYRVDPVNIDGTANVLAAAKAAGADICVATSSASIACRPVSFWRWPWRREPLNWLQPQDESDFDQPLRKRDQYFANYAYSKAKAERMVCAANEEGFRTGCIRPGNGVYGTMKVVDQMIGLNLRLGGINSWIWHVVNSMVSSRNVALSHLQFESVLLNGIGKRPKNGKGKMPPCAGRPFVITDPGQPPIFMDFYQTALELVKESSPDFYLRLVSPLMMLCIAHFVEAWNGFATITGGFLPEFTGYMGLMQPAVFVTSAHCVSDDSRARKSVEEGGIGYKGIHDTLEGLCRQILEFNEETEGGKAREAEKAKAVADQPKL